MTDKHLSTQFDSELNQVSARVMELGGLVESQIRQAIAALSQFSLEAAERVEFIENRVNQMEVEIDHELITIIARRQPTARDLRLLMAFSKATANLERMGDEATRMARMVRSIIEHGAARSLPSSDLRMAADLASGMLRKALDAFARLDTRAALAANVLVLALVARWLADGSDLEALLLFGLIALGCLGGSVRGLIAVQQRMRALPVAGREVV